MTILKVMQWLRITAAALTLCLVAGWSQTALAAETTALASTLERIYLTAYDEAINRHAVEERDHTTYVSTGDIQADWLRDSSAIVSTYIGLAHSDDRIGELLRGVVARQARYIQIDPYANAFSSDYHVVERKFEVDSLLYPIWFAYHYWSETGDRSVFTPEVNASFARVLKVLHDEQHHNSRSSYRHPQLADDGRGSPVRYTGMVWDGFRPSDDPCRYQYNIPVNMFAVVVMRELTSIERNVYHNGPMAANAWGLSVEVERGVERYGSAFLPGFGRIYAYEVDGYGHANLMDDANIPSLLSIPYFGYLPTSDTMYQATRRFALSTRNPYYFVGRYARGIGSPHTPPGYVWPLSLVMQALTSTDPAEVQTVLGYIAASDVGDHRLHESFDANRPDQYTRADFAWPNALYAQLVLTRGGDAMAFAH
ncbi:MAG TPA: glycoside hydrolase family 125 protein [Candidatus Acidoferrales bacterium]|nr:glycoside hydrolase family 125 protein [Candidatus Acidoferrales bacterium]